MEVVKIELVSIENFGPIKKFQCDWAKSLIAIVGKNNVGKSAAMQYLYDNVSGPSFYVPAFKNPLLLHEAMFTTLRHVLREHKQENADRFTLFIEEPEAHMHPEAQIEIAESLARLAKSGVRVVMSTYSNYIFNKFNNLLLAGELTPDMYSAIILQAGEGGKSVSEFMEMDECGVTDTNFLPVAQSLYNEREALIEKRNGWN